VKRVPRRSAPRAAAIAACFACAVHAAPARAVDLGHVGGDPVQLDVTETSAVVQHFDARDNELAQDSGWGAWINRLNAVAHGGPWTVGARLDSALYWRRPIDSPVFATLSPGDQAKVRFDAESRYQNGIYPAKLWASYSAPGVEVTVGDAYAQFGRGLTLSMRKIDELGIDTTIRGGKLEVQQDPFAFTAVAGFANPNRIDDATGRSLFLTTGAPPAPVFGSDRVVGAEIQAGRGLPVTLATHLVRYSRCAPYAYAHDATGAAVTSLSDGAGGVLFGSCSDDDVDTWLQSLPKAPPALRARDITMAGQSLEVPSLGGHGKLYLEAAVQQRSYDPAAPTGDAFGPDGNALYGALSLDAGPSTNTLEIKSNRNFYPVAAGVDLNSAVEFNVVSYSFSPPAETPTVLDTELGYFNACVDGGRLRSDLRASDDLLVYGQGIFAYTRSEQDSGGCDARGHTVVPTYTHLDPATLQDTVWDGLAGVEWSFDGAFSHVFASVGVREDTLSAGGSYYQERHVEYSIVKYLGNAVSLEAQGWHRLRREHAQNVDAAGRQQFWHEGENTLALKLAPSWVIAQGFEYTTLSGQPTYYFNGSILYKLTASSSVRLFVGQQRGAFRCAAGVCRYFPPFEGARAEVTLRF
jgi:hypothetical protein